MPAGLSRAIAREGVHAVPDVVTQLQTSLNAAVAGRV